MNLAALASLFPSPSSVTRWLLVVVGCAVLETAQPMIAAEPAPALASPASSGLAPDRVLYPADSPSASSSSREGPAAGVGSAWIFILLVGLGAGGVWLWRRRQTVAPVRRGGGIVIEDTRALGNRQFLVVASCDGNRFLLGVAQGNIRLLSPLGSHPDAKADDDDA